jgi:hypothetical protein
MERRHGCPTLALLISAASAFFAFRHLIEKGLNRRIRFEHSGVHGIAELLVRLPHLFMRSLHAGILHRFFMRRLQFLPFVRQKIGETLVAMPFPAFALSFLILGAGDGSELRGCR